MADTNDYGSETSHHETTPTTTEPFEPVLLASRRSYQDFLKTCAEGAEINDRGVLVLPTTSDQSSDETIMVDNANRHDDGTMNSSGNDENIESGSRSCEKLSKIVTDEAAVAFKDPFPSLSPMPLKSLQSSRNRLNAQNIARHNAMNTMQDNNNNNNTRSPSSSSSSSATTTTPIIKSNYQNEHLTLSNERDSDDGSSTATPPFHHFNYNDSSTPTRPLLPRSPTAATATTPCNNDQKIWIDPFPTPDVSVHSRCGTPLSSSRQHNTMSDSMSMTEDNSTSFAIGTNLNAHWESIMLNIPNIPIAEESRSNYNNSPVADVEVTDNTRRKDGVAGVGAAKSTSLSRIVCVDYSAAENFPVRKVESMPSMMSKRPSLEDIWGALQVGPDGNDLATTDDYGYLDKNKGRKKRERRASANNISSIWRDEPFEYQGGGLGRPLMRRGKEDARQRSLGAPGKSEAFERRFAASTPAESSWKDLRSPMISFQDDGGQNNESIDTAYLLKNNSATLTNVTGANLAKEVKELIVQRKSIASASANKNLLTRGQSLPLTPNRLRFRVLNNIKTSRAVANAGELVFSPVRSVRNTGKRAAKLVRTTRQKLKERKELRRQRKLARMKAPPRSWWIVIPADHPYKVAWDVITMLWALLGAHRTHVRIRDRVFDQSPLILLTEVWFTIDILLNFVTEHKTRQGQVIRDGKAVWARYLTTWFIIDILSLIPWERVYVRPVVERIKKRNFFQKTFFRSKAVVRVSRVLRGRHIKLFGRVSKQTGTPLRRMVALVIKYLPKYLVFLRNMKGALVVRALRFVHWLHNMYKKIWVKARNAAKHRIGHPIFGLLGYRDDQDDDDSDCSDDDHDGEDEIDTDDESIDEDEDEDENDVLVLMTDSDYDETIHRSVSEGSPPMRRSLSQNELSQRFRRGL
eukprot:CAMPEP_0196139852 /NCGR_PEP_ID=MMETSP0910-20130528/6980_1 /TAXON_ID=49265 /ORGANISM="Thalassiosira rotula, Strain GSO102" /LENGTH=916 /DNA_ID=CAMNT_0041400633 /DNA_START=91 /DNA_END=2841 /DNA_ORIENTATION=-